MDIETYRLNAEVMDRLGMSAGMITKCNQNYSDSDSYLQNLEVLAYDMLYGDRYIYGEKNPVQEDRYENGA